MNTRWLIGLWMCCVAPVLRAQNDLPAILLGHTPHAIDTVAALPEPARPFSAVAYAPMTLRDSVVGLVRAQVGTKYRRGGESPEHGFDCSGLVRYVMSTLHIDLPRTAREQARAGVLVPRDTTSLRPGDLVTFGFGKGISHIGIYVGYGQFIHASSAAGRVIESSIMRPLVKRVKPWRGVRRVLLTEDDSPPSNQ